MSPRLRSTFADFFIESLAPLSAVARCRWVVKAGELRGQPFRAPVKGRYYLTQGDHQRAAPLTRGMLAAANGPVVVQFAEISKPNRPALQDPWWPSSPVESFASGESVSPNFGPRHLRLQTEDGLNSRSEMGTIGVPLG